MTKGIRTYDDEFKTHSASLYLNSGKSYPQLSKELGVPASTLAGWVNIGN
jgi:transposase-like protein